MRFFYGPSIEGGDGRVHWALMRSFDIPCENGLYLRRLRIVQTPWFGVYLHEMWGPDADRDLHDHPWDFYSIVLDGGYIERWSPERSAQSNRQWIHRWPRFSGHVMLKEQGHQIIHLLKVPTYTLIFVGARSREWGFWTRKGWIPWHKYHEVIGGEKAV